MKIVVLVMKNHVYGNKLLKNILDKRSEDRIVVCESTTLIGQMSFIKSIKKLLKSAGLKYILIKAFEQYLVKIGFVLAKIKKPRKIFSLKELSKKYNFKILKVENINSEKIRALIKDLNPDLIISMFFNQILKKAIINLPKKGCINIHPAFLPDYKGVSPIFWALSNNEKNIGVTVHYINKGIDTGEIISQEKINVLEDDSEKSLFFKSVEVGSRLLLKTISDIESNKLKTKKQLIKDSFYSWPTKEDVKKFSKNNKKFYTIKELIKQF